MDEALVWALLWYGIHSLLLYYYFCRLGGSRPRWYSAATYTAASCAWAALQYFHWMGEVLNILPGILLLTACGLLLQKHRFPEALALSSLVISVRSVMAGIAQSFTFWVVSSLNFSTIFRFAAHFQNIATLALLIVVFRVILRSFEGSLRDIRPPHRWLLLIPVLFITFVGAFLSDAVYGNTVVIDSARGLVFPQVNSAELLFLRLLACVCLFSTLFAYKRLTQAMEQEKTLQLLAGQAQNQAVYIKEAKERYAQTHSFRHDIQNHLLVVRQLLAGEKPDAAREYLEKLEEAADALSFPAQTGNDALDALLGSKLAVATAQGIPVDCEMHIPKHSGVDDIDWCIVLANALDNAINASEAMDGPEKEIRIFGSQKGNIYLLRVENRCPASTKPPKAGIGLSNIRAVLSKYDGRMDIEVTDGFFRLSALFVIPQHSGSIPQQSS